MARALNWLTNLAAAALVAAVVLAPGCDTVDEPASAWERLLALFARDRVLRHTAGVSALALVVTARIFFIPRQPTSDAEPPRQSAA
jgi:hypothetical protein